MCTIDATVTLTSSTLVNNSAQFGGGIASTGDSFTLTNSTLAHNTAVRSAGILTANDDLTLVNTTVSGNTATDTVGGIRLHDAASATATNSIVAGNSGGDVDDGTLSGSNNLIGGNPMLGSLTDNGGPTQTMVPQPGSPAIDAGACHIPNVSDGIPTVDQRGAPRPMGAGCDIGAVEHIVTAALRGLGQNGQYALAGDAFAWPLVVQALAWGGNPVSGIKPEVRVPASGASATCTSEPTDATGVARIVCTANWQAGSYVVHISTPYGPNEPPLDVAYTLTNLPNIPGDRIFGSGFEGVALPTTGASP